MPLRMCTTSTGQVCSRVTTVSGTTVPTLTLKLTLLSGSTCWLLNTCSIWVRCCDETDTFAEVLPVVWVSFRLLDDLVAAEPDVPAALPEAPDEVSVAFDAAPLEVFVLPLLALFVVPAWLPDEVPLLMWLDEPAAAPEDP